MIFRRRGFVLLLFAGAAALYSVRLASPFETVVETAGAMYSVFARNYEKFGYSLSRLAPLDAAGPDLASYPSVPHQMYAHRPPTVSLLLSLPVRLFGAREWVTRGTCVLAALATLALFLAIAGRLLGPDWGLLASAMFALMPIISYFAVTTVHQVFGLLGALSIVLAYLRWRENSSRPRWIALHGVILGACWLDWPAYFAAGGVGLLHFWTAERKRWQAFLLPLTAVAAFALFLGWLFLLDPEHRVPLKALLQSGGGHAGSSLSLTEYLLSEGREMAISFTIPLLLLSAVGAARLRPKSFPDAAVLSLLLLGADEILFPSMCAWHIYLTLPLAPFAALTAASAVRSLIAREIPCLAAQLLLAGFVVQSAAVLHHRHTFTGYYEYQRAFSHALNRHTRPGDRILIRLKNDPYLRTYYADRYAVTFVPPEAKLQRQYINAPEPDVDEAELIRRLSRPDPGFDWFVTLRTERAAERFAWIRSLRGRPDFDDFLTENFWMESDRRPTELLRFLSSRFPALERDGFLFFDLRRPR